MIDIEDIIFPIQFKTQCFNFVASVGVSANDYDSNATYRNDSQEISYGISTLSGVEGQIFLYTNYDNSRIIQWNAIGY